MAEISENPIHLLVVTPERKVYDGSVQKVSLPMEDGYMGFHPGHYPLLGVIGTGELTYYQDDAPHFMAISGGLVEVGHDEIRVLADVAETPEMIDIARAEKARERAKQVLHTGEKARKELMRASVTLQKSISRVRVANRRQG